MHLLLGSPKILKESQICKNTFFEKRMCMHRLEFLLLNVYPSNILALLNKGNMILYLDGCLEGPFFLQLNIIESTFHDNVNPLFIVMELSFVSYNICGMIKSTHQGGHSLKLH